MYLFEIRGKLPKRADKAVLEWCDCAIPKREGVKIYLPDNALSIFFRLQEGKQFLFEKDKRYWFGGTDEEPFLVEMEQQVITNYIKKNGSENVFYRSLVPEIVANIAAETNTIHKRQGDIFAARFCHNLFLKDLEKLIEFGGYHRDYIQVKEGSFNLLGTRHEGKGTAVKIEDKLLFSGVVNAPDHALLSLDDGLYVIGQTQYIVDPRKAD